MAERKTDIRVWRVEAHRQFSSAWYDLIIIGTEEVTPPGKELFALDPEKGWVPSPSEGSPWSDWPTIRLSEDQVQDVVNRLWDAGIRPNQAKGSSGQLEAVNKHLQDMRAITFDRLKIKKE